MKFVDVYFSLGTNLGSKQNNIDNALKNMDKAFSSHYDKLSEIIETEPWGFVSSDNFLNCAVKYRLPKTRHSIDECLDILDKCKAIEESMGRHEVIEYDATGKRIYHSRIIDIDILFYGDRLLKNDRLNVPHPMIAQREFVLEPLREIATDNLKQSFPEIFQRN